MCKTIQFFCLVDWAAFLIISSNVCSLFSRTLPWLDAAETRLAVFLLIYGFCFTAFPICLYKRSNLYSESSLWKASEYIWDYIIFDGFGEITFSLLLLLLLSWFLAGFLLLGLAVPWRKGELLTLFSFLIRDDSVSESYTDDFLFEYFL